MPEFQNAKSILLLVAMIDNRQIISYFFCLDKLFYSHHRDFFNKDNSEKVCVHTETTHLMKSVLSFTELFSLFSVVSFPNKYVSFIAGYIIKNCDTSDGPDAWLFRSKILQEMQLFLISAPIFSQIHITNRSHAYRMQAFY